MLSMIINQKRKNEGDAKRKAKTNPAGQPQVKRFRRNAKAINANSAPDKCRSTK